MGLDELPSEVLATYYMELMGKATMVDFEGTLWPRSGGRLYHHITQRSQSESESENPSFVFLKPEVSQ